MDDLLGAIRSELQIPTLSTRVAQHFEQLILDGHLRPGARLVEESIARQLGISRASLREAMIGLEQAGLISREGRNNRIIRKLGDRDVEELYEMWTILESEAAAKACLIASDEDREAIASVMEAMEEADGRAAYHRLNLDFHRALARACPNRQLLRAYEACLKQVHWIWALAIGQAGDPDISRREHRQIARAYLARNAERTRDLIRSHLSEGARRTLKASRRNTASK